MYSYKYKRIVSLRFSLGASRAPVFAFRTNAIMKDKSAVQNRSITYKNLKEGDSKII